MEKFIVSLSQCLLLIRKPTVLPMTAGQVAYLLTVVREIGLVEPHMPPGFAELAGYTVCRRVAASCRGVVSRSLTPTPCPKLHGRYTEEIALNGNLNRFSETRRAGNCSINRRASTKDPKSPKDSRFD